MNAALPSAVECMAEEAAAHGQDGEARVWRVRAAAYRRMAGSAREVERERKLLALAAEFEERAALIEREAEDEGEA